VGNQGVLFSVIASYQIGTGHLIRCLNIAEHLGGAPVFFCIDGDENLSSFFIRDRRIEVFKPERLSRLRPKVVVVDRLEVEPNLLLPFKEIGAEIILLDNLSGWEMADVVINALPHPPSQHPVPDGVKIFEGPHYICLSREILQARENPRAIRKAVSKILVTCGGSDPYGLTLKLAKALVQLPDLPFTTFILGRIFKERKKLEEIIQGAPASVIQDPLSLAPSMVEADMALTSFGLTVYEVACLGLPAIILPPTKDHCQRAEVFAKYGAAINLRLNEEVSTEKIAEEIQRLRFNPKLRREMSQAGQRLVDGRGAIRVAQIILELLKD